MNRKKIALFIIALGLLLLLAIVVYFAYFSRSKQLNFHLPRRPQAAHLPANQQNPSRPANQRQPAAKINFSPAAKEPEQVGRESLGRLAASFAERFGSFSNQANFDNIKDLEVLMTEKMRLWSRNYIKELKVQEQTGQFYAITTKALNAKVVSYDSEAGQAKVKVTTQRQETKGQAAPAVFYQDLVLQFAKQNGKWKVDSIAWGEK